MEQSQKWKLNWNDVKNVAKWTLIFFSAPIVMYLGQLQGDLSQYNTITTLIPNATTIGAIEGWGIGIIVNFFLALKDGK